MTTRSLELMLFPVGSHVLLSLDWPQGPGSRCLLISGHGGTFCESSPVLLENDLNSVVSFNPHALAMCGHFTKEEAETQGHPAKTWNQTAEEFTLSYGSFLVWGF